MLLDAVIEELFPEVLIASEDDPLRELFRAARADDWRSLLDYRHASQRRTTHSSCTISMSISFHTTPQLQGPF